MAVGLWSCVVMAVWVGIVSGFSVVWGVAGWFSRVGCVCGCWLGVWVDVV